MKKKLKEKRFIVGMKFMCTSETENKQKISKNI